MNTELTTIDSATIAKIDDVGELGRIISTAKAAEIFYQAQDAWEAAQKASEIKLRAIHRAGRILLPPEQGGMTIREATRGLKKGPVITLGNDGATPYQEMLEEAHEGVKVSRIVKEIGPKNHINLVCDERD